MEALVEVDELDLSELELEDFELASAEVLEPVLAPERASLR